jgi:hypothetical protein
MEVLDKNCLRLSNGLDLIRLRIWIQVQILELKLKLNSEKSGFLANSRNKEEFVGVQCGATERHHAV